MTTDNEYSSNDSVSSVDITSDEESSDNTSSDVNITSSERRRMLKQKYKEKLKKKINERLKLKCSRKETEVRKTRCPTVIEKHNSGAKKEIVNNISFPNSEELDDSSSSNDNDDHDEEYTEKEHKEKHNRDYNEEQQNNESHVTDQNRESTNDSDKESEEDFAKMAKKIRCRSSRKGYMFAKDSDPDVGNKKLIHMPSRRHFHFLQRYCLYFYSIGTR